LLAGGGPRTVTFLHTGRSHLPCPSTYQQHRRPFATCSRPHYYIGLLRVKTKETPPTNDCYTYAAMRGQLTTCENMPTEVRKSHPASTRDALLCYSCIVRRNLRLELSTTVTSWVRKPQCCRARASHRSIAVALEFVQSLPALRKQCRLFGAPVRRLNLHKWLVELGSPNHDAQLATRAPATIQQLEN
jgi:hypothetical protein